MRATRQRDTPAELAIRSALHRQGFRYRVDAVVLDRRRADIVFHREMVAVFVDGCFWHGCPVHGTLPKTNRDWWREKLAGNCERDRDTDWRLRRRGWTVLRFWAHEEPRLAAKRIAGILRAKREG